MVSTTVGTMALQPDIGAGKRAIMMLPSGMMTFERAERAFVDRVERPGQRLVGDARARVGARVDRRLALGRAAGQIDGHVAALDVDLDARSAPLRPLITPSSSIDAVAS